MQMKAKKADLQLAIAHIAETSQAEWITVDIDEATENLVFRYEDGNKYLAEVELHPASQAVTPKLRTTRNLYKED